MKKKDDDGIEPKTIELVKNIYNPTKAELEDEFSLAVPGSTPLERLSNLTRAMVQPVKVRWIGKPRRGRSS